jgi:hypothetical protein
VLDYRGVVDRVEQVRASRRRLAEDALHQERDRERVLREELQDVVASLDGDAFDEGIHLALGADDAERVKRALGHIPAPAAEFDWDDSFDESGGLLPGVDFFEDDDDESPGAEDPWFRESNELELVRLQEEIDASRLTQAALERYLELLETHVPLPADPPQQDAAP